MFKVDINQKENEVVVTLTGEFDNIATTEMGDTLDRAIALAGGKVVVECREMEYISSSGLRFFMQMKRASEQQGGSIVVRNLNEDVEEIFRLSGFHHIFTIE